MDDMDVNRQLTRRQTVVAFLLIGFLGAVAVMAVGDYQMNDRLPTFEEVLIYILVGAILGPVLAFAIAVIGGWLPKTRLVIYGAVLLVMIMLWLL